MGVRSQRYVGVDRAEESMNRNSDNVGNPPGNVTPLRVVRPGGGGSDGTSGSDHRLDDIQRHIGWLWTAVIGVSIFGLTGFFGALYWLDGKFERIADNISNSGEQIELRVRESDQRLSEIERQSIEIKTEQKWLVSHLRDRTLPPESDSHSN